MLGLVMLIDRDEKQMAGEVLRVAAVTHLAAALQALDGAGFKVLAARVQHVLDDVLDEPGSKPDQRDR